MDQSRISSQSGAYEKDVINILMDSNLYLELTLQERQLLLKHIGDFYRTTDVPSTENYS